MRSWSGGYTCRRELLDRTLIWNQRHLLHALREYERFYNGHRPYPGIANTRPLHPLPAENRPPSTIIPAVREVAVQLFAAGFADDPNTLPWLRDRATSDDHRRVRHAAMRVLTRIDS